MSRSTKHPVLRWIKRGVLALLGLVVFAVGGALAALHTDWGRDLVRQQIEKQMANTFTGGATIGKLEGSPFTELVVRQLVIDGPDQKPAIRVGALRLKLSLWPLISHHLELDRVIADDVDVALKRDADGSLQIARLTKPGPPSAWSIALPDVEVHRGHVMADTGAADPSLRVVDADDVQVDAKARLPHGGTTNATAIVHGVWRQRGVPIDLALTLRADDELVNAPAVLLSAGGVELAVGDLRMAKGDKLAVSGAVAVNAPAAAVAHLVPSVELPADVAAAVVVGARGDETTASIMGRVGATPLRAIVRGDVAGKHGSGVVVTGDVDAAALTHGRVNAHGGAVIAFDATAPAAAGELPVAQAVVTAWGALHGEPRMETTFAVTTDATHVRATIGATTPGARIGLGAALTKHGDDVTLDLARLVAGARDPARITPKSPALYGSLRANLSAHGALSPRPNLAVAGSVDGQRLRFADLSIASLKLRVDVKGLPHAPLGSGHVAITDLVKGPDVSLAELTVDAANHTDGTWQVGVRSRPKTWPWLVEADALVTPGPTTIVQLQRHHVRANGTDWAGTTGRFEIGPRGMSLHGLKTASSKGAFGVDFDYTHTQTAGHVALAANGTMANVGTASVALDLDAPASLGDAAGWSKLSRAALRKGELTVDADVGKAAALVDQPDVAGKLAVKVAITPTDLTGSVDVRGLTTPATAAIGAISAHLDLAQHGGSDFTAQAVAKIDGVGGMHFDAAFATPARPFDAAGWRAVLADRASFKGAHVKLDEVSLDPGLFDQFHVQTRLRGMLDFAIDVPAGAGSVQLACAVHELRGGALARPLDVTLGAQIDDRGTTGHFGVRMARGDLVAIDAKVPLTLAQLIADPKGALATQLHVDGKIPDVSARELLATFGRSDITKGTIGGTLSAEGTLAKPIVTAKLVGTDIEAPPGLASTEPQTMRKLTLDASWDGATGKVKVAGDEASGGTLAISAQGSPAAPNDVTAKLEAHKFDVRTLTAFAPGVVGGITGELDGSLTVKGANPRTMDVGGTLVFAAARVPIAPEIGTLRQARIQIAIANHVVKIDATGKLGHEGTVKLVAEAPLSNGAPTGGKATLTVRKVAPIGAVQPVIDSDITATISRKSDSWAADVKIANTLVKIPDEKGHALDPVGPPTDMVYGKRKPKRAPQLAKADPKQKAPPPHPLFTATVDLGVITVESSDARGALRGKLDVSLGQAAVGGSPIGITGDIYAQRGEIELFDRRYQLERAALHFDGSPDAQIDVRITYDFPDVTTVTEVHGRISKPELALSSEPGMYSQGELLGFLLGGEPNGDTQQSQSASARVSGAGTSLLANQLGGYVKKALPVSVDVIKYEAASDISSAAFTVGSWVTHTLFVAYKEHLDARPDENDGEGDVEYYIEPRLFLDGTVGDRGYDGLDLLWRKRW